MPGLTLRRAVGAFSASAFGALRGLVEEELGGVVLGVGLSVFGHGAEEPLAAGAQGNPGYFPVLAGLHFGLVAARCCLSSHICARAP
eukprot:7397274-Pyramimonas_sp.AAC.1